ncbi:MAG: hypothetical protein J4N84_15010 [Chloroflexi bacterium]|nr:hypothetical protein [Chloroflexota bacterium]MCI0896203.1 hypothetical protein [Chloroflexota bacterium]
MIRQILEDCQPGFAEVVLMLSNSSATAEVYTMLEDLRFTEDGNTVTFMAEGGTHLHLNMEQVKEVRFIQTTNEQGLPSYSVWFVDKDKEPVLRVYMRKSEKEETNQPRHDLFMRLQEKYGETLAIGS